MAERVVVRRLLLNMLRYLPVFLPWQLAFQFTFLSFKYHSKLDISWNLTHLFHSYSSRFGEEARFTSNQTAQEKARGKHNFHKFSLRGQKLPCKLDIFWSSTICSNLRVLQIDEHEKNMRENSKNKILAFIKSALWYWSEAESS